VKPVAGTRLIEISFTHSDPKVAAAVVNDLTRALMDYGFTTRNSATNQTSAWLGHQLEDLKKQAHDLQARVVELQRYTGIYSLGEDAQGRDQVYSATLDQLQQATTALSTATSSRIMKGALYDTISHGDPEMISSLAGSSIGASSATVQNSLTLLQNLRTQQATVAAQLAQDTSKFGSDYPKLADERSNLAYINKAVNDEIERIGERAKNDYEASRTTESKLQSVYDERKLQAGKLNDRAIEYGIAKQEADNSRMLYEDLSKRLKEAGVIEGLRSSNISVVSPGRVSPKPSTPNPPLYLAGAIVLGLFFGVCAALYSDMTDRTVQSFGVVEESLGIIFFAVLPSLVKRTFKDLLPASLAKFVAKENTTQTDPLVVLNNPTSAFAEALRRMRMSLLSSRGAPSPRVILVTSSVPDEGKTTVAVNTAALLAQSGKSVLFVEADLRQPGSTRLFDPSQGTVPGLSDLLSNPKQLMLANQVKEIPNMQILPSGATTLYPTELLGTARMGELLKQWKLQFDYIVIDAPSLLDVTDAFILSELADITLLVARYGFTTNKSLERAYQMLASDPETRIGVVLNAADRSSVSYTDYYGYSGSPYYQTS
jgi:polysaccharide biosynthesis transport protein